MTETLLLIIRMLRFLQMVELLLFIIILHFSQADFFTNGRIIIFNYLDVDIFTSWFFHKWPKLYFLLLSCIFHKLIFSQMTETLLFIIILHFSQADFFTNDRNFNFNYLDVAFFTNGRIIIFNY